MEQAPDTKPSSGAGAGTAQELHVARAGQAHAPGTARGLLRYPGTGAPPSTAAPQSSVSAHLDAGSVRQHPGAVPYSALHHELLQHVQAHSPTAQDLAHVEHVRARVEAVAIKLSGRTVPGSVKPHVQLYGSHAYGCAVPGSDIDLALVGLPVQDDKMQGRGRKRRAGDDRASHTDHAGEPHTAGTSAQQSAAAGPSLHEAAHATAANAAADKAPATADAAAADKAPASTPQNEAQKDGQQDGKPVTRIDMLEKLLVALSDDIVPDGNNRVVGTARIPVLKAEFQLSGGRVSVDITTAGGSGAQGTALIRQLIDLLPALRPVLFFMKRLLKEAGRGDASKGGLSSYCTTLLVVAALLTHSSYRPLAGHVSMLCAQLRDSSQHPEPRPMPQQHPALSAHEDVGDLLRHVLHALAYQFDPDHQCISIIRSGLFMPRNGVQWRGRQAQAVKRRFYIEDPLVEGDNAARAASEVAGIMAVFRLAHHKLQEAGVMGAGSSGAVVASGSGQPILSSLLAGSRALLESMAPEQPYAFNGHAAAPPGSLPPPPPPPPPPLPPMLQPSHHSQQAPLHNELENEVTAMRASITPPSKRRRIQTYYDDLEKDAEILKTLLTDPF